MGVSGLSVLGRCRGLAGVLVVLLGLSVWVVGSAGPAGGQSDGSDAVVGCPDASVGFGDVGEGHFAAAGVDCLFALGVARGAELEMKRDAA